MPLRAFLKAALLAVLTVLSLPLAVERRANAVELSASLGLFNRGSYAHRQIEDLLRFDMTTESWAYARYLKPLRNDLAYSVLAVAEFDLFVDPAFEVFLSVDSGVFRPMGRRPVYEQWPGTLPDGVDPPGVPTRQYANTPTSDGLALEDASAEAGFIRQFGIRGEVGQGFFEYAVGRLRHRIADGLIYDDWALGAQLSVDLEALDGPPLVFDLSVALPSHGYENFGAVLASFRGEWVWSALEGVGVSGSVLVDDAGRSTQRLLDAWTTELAWNIQGQPLGPDAAALLTNNDGVQSATLWWAGLHVSRMFGDVLFIANALVQGGSLTLAPMNDLLNQAGFLPGDLTSGPTEVDSLGVAVDVSARILLTRRWSLEVFGFYVSGGENPLIDDDVELGHTYGSYIAVRPHVTWTNIFFAGGLNEALTDRNSTASGVAGRGVIAGGVRADFALDHLTFKATLAGLGAQSESIHGGAFYGVELDLEFDTQITDWLRLSLEYDILVPGDFFDGGLPMHQLLVGLDVTWEASTEDADEDGIP